jgi:hypothetical protein
MDIESTIDKALRDLGRAAKSQDANAARNVLRDLLETTLASSATSQHQQRLAEIGDDKVALCRYWGELGITKGEAERQLDIKIDSVSEEARAMEKGTFDRRAEARAIELGEARSGGKVLPWMTSLS